jgi:hypothetical protein
MIIDAMCVLLALNLKENLVKIENLYAVSKLCKDNGHLQEFCLMAVDFIPRTTESSGIL